MIQAIFFDFNGVIIDDEPLQMQAYKEVLRGHDIDLSEADYYSALGLDDKGFVRHAFQRANKILKDDVLEVVLEEKGVRHRKLIEDELPLFPGVVTFLKATGRHYPLGIVSMATFNEIEYALSRAQLLPLFSVVVSSADVSVCKPAPDCYRVGFDKMNEQRRTTRLLPLLPSECLVIEDSPPGIAAGKSAGMLTMGITNTVSETALREAGADVVTASLADWTVGSVHHVFGKG
ncbi:MAG TPA: HAD family phosphatase [Pyrinomonadaceae bacterium]|nr:HAD family phosphatase [Pyrinomonadaceae bacterium]